jgi:hypothetical protein
MGVGGLSAFLGHVGRLADAYEDEQESSESELIETFQV